MIRFLAWMIWDLEKVKDQRYSGSPWEQECMEKVCRFKLSRQNHCLCKCKWICYSSFIFGGGEVIKLQCDGYLYGVWNHHHSYSKGNYEFNTVSVFQPFKTCLKSTMHSYMLEHQCTSFYWIASPIFLWIRLSSFRLCVVEISASYV